MIPPYPRLDTAEYVSPGHPDRLADAIAEGFVEFAQAQVPPDRLSRSLVGVEVAVHDSTVFIDGRIALDGPFVPVPFDSIVRRVYTRAGYGSPWGPDPGSLEIITRVCVERLTPEEADIRSYADDQNVVHGYAINRPETNFLPAAHWLAHHIGHAVGMFRGAHPERYGPDFKVFVDVHDDGRRVEWRRLVLSLQHVHGVSMEDQHRELLAPLQGCLARAEAAGISGTRTTFCPHHLHLNGAGDFTVGGPRGDNGLSGKKLVVDHYGPSVPIGGGALCGKDAWKIDRCGPLRARQWAKELVARGYHQAFTTLGWAPGEDQASICRAWVVGGSFTQWRALEPSSRQAAAAPFSIHSIVRRLGLTKHPWRSVLQSGTFLDGAHPWEVSAAGLATSPLGHRSR